MNINKVMTYSGARINYLCYSCSTGDDAFCRCSNVVVNYDEHTCKPLHHYLELVNHSPTGFEWGYAGSGPSQLAFAILMDFTNNEELTRKLYQQFKHDFISPIQSDMWEIDVNKIMEWINERNFYKKTMAGFNA